MKRGCRKAPRKSAPDGVIWKKTKKTGRTSAKLTNLEKKKNWHL